MSLCGSPVPRLRWRFRSQTWRLRGGIALLRNSVLRQDLGTVHPTLVSALHLHMSMADVNPSPPKLGWGG
jgi:hypothetical protein